MKLKTLKIAGISIWRLLAYFIIYSIAGYLIETVYAFIVYGVVESRQSFLYGPFCSIYGVGAVVMICVLQFFNKNGHTLFLGGFLAGSVTEYVISYLGEVLFNTKWWDYSDRFLNLNGRICFLFSIFWGLLGVYLIKVLNPHVDKLIDWIKSKINITALKIVTIVVIIFMFVDCVISGIAVSVFSLRVAIENDLNVPHKEIALKEYNKVYAENQWLPEVINKYFGNEKMVKTYPNLTLKLDDGSTVYLRDYFPDIQSYYIKLNR